MRQPSNPKRGRGRSNNGRKPGNSRNQTFDSNGPSIRVRGNAYQVMEKYLTLARDASASGDRIAAENYYQHAEHYYRILNVNNTQDRPAAPRQPNGRDANGSAEGTVAEDNGEAPAETQSEAITETRTETRTETSSERQSGNRSRSRSKTSSETQTETSSEPSSETPADGTEQPPS